MPSQGPPIGSADWGRGDEDEVPRAPQPAAVARGYVRRSYRSRGRRNAKKAPSAYTEAAANSKPRDQLFVDRQCAASRGSIGQAVAAERACNHADKTIRAPPEPKT